MRAIGVRIGLSLYSEGHFITNAHHMDKVETFDFSMALGLARAGRKISRIGWNNPNIYVAVQVPNELSANTEPYLYMVKTIYMPSVNGEEVPSKTKRVPLDLSAESIFAEDWYLVEELEVAPAE